jgi:uncharacterized protein (TIGR02453 family)
MPRAPRFSKQTLDFIEKASRQKKPDWLDRHRDEYERHLLEPIQHLARTLKSELGSLANGYHFPQKGLARLKRSANKAEEYGSAFRGWVTYSAARPRKSRFEHNPNLFFLLQPEDEDGDDVLLAGGLYMPSSRQLRALREAVAHDASAFERLFATKEFAASFPGGFSDERISTRPPRGFDKEHPKMHWLKLQAFFVWKPYKRKDFASADFAKLVARDCRQILRMNELIDQAIAGRAPQAQVEADPQAQAMPRPGLVSHLEKFQAPKRKMDF